MTHHTEMVLEHLHREVGKTTLELSEETGLTQPQVSSAAGKLRKSGRLRSEATHGVRNGRGCQIYLHYLNVGRRQPQSELRQRRGRRKVTRPVPEKSAFQRIQDQLVELDQIKEGILSALVEIESEVNNCNRLKAIIDGIKQMDK